MSIDEIIERLGLWAVRAGDTIGPFIEQLEGPYKWYVVAGVSLLLTAIISRFIFKTIKWFLILFFILMLFGTGFWLVGEWAGL